MINSVRNTVLSILNKNNYGYLSPQDFNLFAKQAQMEIFIDYFYQLNYNINKENVRQSASGLSNLSQKYKQAIERFIVPPTVLTQDADNVYFAPSTITTGSDHYQILNVYCYDTSVTPKRFLGEADKVNPIEIKRLEISLLQYPSSDFPIYNLADNKIYIYPQSINTANAVEAQYIRFPKDPKWTFTSLGTQGIPVFDQSKPDFQDFEIELEDEPELIVKICKYAGIMIREADVYQFARQEEQITTQTQQ